MRVTHLKTGWTTADKRQQEDLSEDSEARTIFLNFTRISLSSEAILILFRF
jgi:hypothetical protein